MQRSKLDDFTPACKGYFSVGNPSPWEDAQEISNSIILLRSYCLIFHPHCHYVVSVAIVESTELSIRSGLQYYQQGARRYPRAVAGRPEDQRV